MAGNPNPAAISGPLWGLWERLHVYDKKLKLGGIYAAKTGYHDRRIAVSARDYSVGEVPADRNGPGDKASAIDLTPATQAGMVLYTGRLDAAARARDERLFIGGVPIIREFIGTKNNITVYCWVLTGGRARGLPADAGVDFGRDESHLWHLHISIIRQFCADQAAMDRLYSVLAGESLAAWRARTRPADRTESLTVQEDDVSQQVIPLPNMFGYDEGERKLPGGGCLSVPVEPAGLAENKIFGTKRLYLSLAADHTEDGPALVRVAIHDGVGWIVHTIVVKSGGRVSVPVPAPRNGAAFNIAVGRKRSAADAPQTEADLPVSLLVTVA